MDEKSPIPQALTTLAAQNAIQKVKRSRGRPFGAKNYSGISIIARTMKEKGIYWVDELIDSYILYKRQLNKYILDPGSPQPSNELLTFWQTVLPYITVKMIDRETRRERTIKTTKRKVSAHAIEALAKMEGRKTYDGA